MANTISFSVDINPDYTAKITDTTNYSDPLRSDVAVFMEVFKMNHLSERTELDATVDSSDPFVVSSATIDIVKDGWYSVAYVAIPKYDVTETYAQYDAVIDPGTLVVYRSTQSGNIGQPLTDTDYWVEVVYPTTLADNKDTPVESGNIDSLIFNTIIVKKAGDYLQDKTLEAAREGASVLKEPTEVIWYQYIADVSIQAAFIAATRQQFAAAERYIRRIDELVQP